MSIARTTPAQKPRGAQSTTRRGGLEGVALGWNMRVTVWVAGARESRAGAGVAVVVADRAGRGRRPRLQGYAFFSALSVQTRRDTASRPPSHPLTLVSSAPLSPS